ncbi:NAD(P)-binding protein [Parerythrobacter jejuensis]|uniref:NAD(P)-binding protein n=1 Tax=Parerythrobacter jejuensis TaxID=795812 RepID=A0A845ANN5_9SPHN|nr:NAD(P)-binding protein [Parerythrobacter jejuensis]MXP30461.1 NAD(P)-binding protein [Parerythrobacter jejuensis]MXP33221.1 NAD(P)-binding protein [Parerythrobacter jejuensis]
MPTLDTDYLIIGAGAVGLSFADVVLQEDPDAHLTIVDKHSKPGGHWNDAYSFVALHQPSASYGINSVDLGSNRIDEAGPNKGYYELASGPEVVAYFDNVMRDHFLPTGRVDYHPLSEYTGEHTFRGVLSGQETKVKVRRKVVDGTFYDTSVPSTHTRKFEVANDVRIVVPGALPDLWKKPDEIPAHYCILGAGKTAMDAGVWLVEAGIDPSKISWVRPRDSWMLNRQYTQPGVEFFEGVIASQIRQMEACAQASDANDLFLRLEAGGDMLRLDKDVVPTMFHYPTISVGEVERLQTITDVIRKGRVRSIERGVLHLEQGEHAMPADTLYIDCTASAVHKTETKPQFEEGLITPQLMHVPLVTLNASITAFLEVHLDTDEEKNALSAVSPFCHSIEGFPATVMGTGMSRMRWAQYPELMAWLERSRLNPASRAIAQLKQEDPSKLAILAPMQAAVMAAGPNLMRLAAMAED